MRTEPGTVTVEAMRLIRRSLVITGLAAALVVTGVGVPGVASAHQPVRLDSSDPTPGKGPLLVDGTVSFAVYAPLAARKLKRGFRFRMQAGQPLRVQLLITDVAPANTLPDRRQPKVTVISPSGRRIVLTINERTPFYEPYGGTSYLYLSRYSGVAEKGTYRVWVKSRSSAPVNAVIGVGYREVPGVVRN